MLDHMSGLRRVTLNRNPLIADRGATFLAEVLEADLWIKGKRVFLLHLLLFNDQSQLTDEYIYIYSFFFWKTTDVLLHWSDRDQKFRLVIFCVKMRIDVWWSKRKRRHTEHIENKRLNSNNQWILLCFSASSILIVWKYFRFFFSPWSSRLCDFKSWCRKIS